MKTANTVKMVSTIVKLAVVLAAIATTVSGTLAAAQKAADGEQNTFPITLRVYDYAHAGQKALHAAERETARILANAGVTAHWVDCPTKQSDVERYPACPTATQEAEYTLRLLSDSMTTAQEKSQDALGNAADCERGACIASVYYDRIKNLAGGNTPGTCNETVTFSNTGTTSEDIDVILGRPYGSGAAVAALDQLLVSYATNDHGGYTSLSYAAITSSLAQPMQVASLEPRQSITVRLALSLAGGVKGSTANAWNGATVYLPYMVTATVSASAPVGGPPIVVKVVPHLTIAAVGPWTLFANQLVHCRI